MLDPRQDRALQDLARSIAHSVDVLGSTCTATLLGSIALGLLDSPESDRSTESKGPADDPVLRSASTQPSRPRKHRQTASHRDIHRLRPRTRP
jgi:hypothetical protein